MAPRCPKCSCSHCVEKKHVLSVGFFEPLLFALLPLLTASLSYALSFSSLERAIFTLFSFLPSLIRIKEKFLCEECGLEFYDLEEAKVEDKVKALYPRKE